MVLFDDVFGDDGDEEKEDGVAFDMAQEAQSDASTTARCCAASATAGKAGSEGEE